MLLRSNNPHTSSAPEHDTNDSRIEHLHEDESPIEPDLEHSELSSSAGLDSSASTSKFLALKRKLFPTRKRRHPVRIPPLVVVSPITSSVKSNSRSEERQEEPFSAPSNNQEQPQYPFATVDADRQRLIRMAVELAGQIGLNNGAPCTSDEQEDIDDDLELEYAIAAMDTETSTSEETLAEVRVSYHRFP